MAQRVVVTLSDDIDGSEAAETIAFGLDGKSYEIDLNEANAKKLRKALAPYVDAGRKRSRSGKAYKQTQVAPDPAAVRAALSTLGMPIRSVECRIWRCRFEVSTTSSSTIPSVPTPAAAR